MKKSGILMPVFSLPSPYGIGTLGDGAYEFARYVKASRADIWQVLPVGPTGYGDSPYQSFSSFAGNPYFIDPDRLVRDGFLKKKDLPPKVPEGEKIDYGAIYFSRGKMLEKAYEYSYGKVKDEVAEFASSRPDIKDYAVFMTAKDACGGACWHDFPSGVKLRRKSALARFEARNADRVNYYLFVQYLFFTQWQGLKKYVNSLGIKLLGDMPIYVAPDSSDVWANHRSFLLGPDREPERVAAVPPDYFSEDGQKWGNPLYNWQYLRRHGFDFWVRRMRAAGEMFDIVRLDHFIGFANYYSVEASAPTAKDGYWTDGPGMALFRAIKKNVPGVTLIAEDLGVVSDKVTALVEKSRFPSMRVLQFAFGGGDDNIHLPENFTKNTLLYTGTHDNAPTLDWWENASAAEREDAGRRIGKTPDMPWALINYALKTHADTVIIPMWDVLSLGAEGRVNTPGTSSGNWAWRIKKVPGKAKALRRGRTL